MCRFIVLVSLVSILNACGEAGAPEESPIAVVESALTLDQCNYPGFLDNKGKIQICHYDAKAKKKKFVISKVSAAECLTHVAEHVAGQPDFVAFGDKDCKGDGCLPEDVPCDPTVPCCDGLMCANASGVASSVGTCQDLDACVHNPCGANEDCHDLPAPADDDENGRTCTCAAGYEWDPGDEQGDTDHDSDSDSHRDSDSDSHRDSDHDSHRDSDRDSHRDSDHDSGHRSGHGCNHDSDHDSDRDSGHGDHDSDHGSSRGSSSCDHHHQHPHPGQGCVAIDLCVRNNVVCAAPDACHAPSTCVPATGLCEIGAALPTDDKNACTTDACDPVGGVSNTPNPIVSDDNACTEDTCDPLTGKAVYTPTPGTACGSDTDAECDGADTCDEKGVCQLNLADKGAPCGDGWSTPASVCDNADTCDGAGACLPNHEPATKVCRDDTGDCDVTEYCDGKGTCPSDAFEAAGSPCKGLMNTGACDGDDVCDGNNGCIDVFKVATVCNESKGQCDVAELCDGTSSLCPADVFADASVACDGESTGGPCDGADHCSGTENKCIDVFAGADVICWASVGQCDVTEFCTGNSGACPEDVFAAASVGCVGEHNDGDCDGDDHCSGTENTCVDVFKPSSFVCRDQDGPCDVAENCTGSASACPGDGFAADTVTCIGTSNGGVCDGADHCSGTDKTCVDGYLAATVVCNPKNGQCDVAETCTGSSGSCPADAFEPPTTTCTGTSQGGFCDAPDTCAGTSDTCVDNFKDPSVVCRADAGECDVSESCTGTSGACPANAFEPSGTSCGSPSDTVCDNPDTCLSGTCQPNHEPDSNMCLNGEATCPAVDNVQSGEFYVDTAEDLVALSAFTVISGRVIISTQVPANSEGDRVVSIPCLREFSGLFKVQGTNVDSISLSANRNGTSPFSGEITIENNPELDVVDLGHVTSKSGTLVIQNNCMLDGPDIHLPQTVTGSQVSPNGDCVFPSMCSGCNLGEGNGTRPCQAPNTVCLPYEAGQGNTCRYDSAQCTDLVGNGCSPNPCGPNSSGCLDGINTVTCTCTNGYSGPLCQTPPPCAASPCQNDGMCSNGANGTYTCACQAGWTGNNCQTAAPTITQCTGCYTNTAGPCMWNNTTQCEAFAYGTTCNSWAHPCGATPPPPPPPAGQCTGCGGGTSGPCKSGNTLCYPYETGTTCPYYASPCP